MPLLTEEERANIGTASQVASVFSLFGSLFIIVCYVRYKDLRSYAFTMVLWMAVSDFWATLAKLFGDTGEINPNLCQVQAWIMSAFELASVLWAVAIAFTLHRGFILTDPNFAGNAVATQEKKYHAVIWSTCFVLTFLPATTNSYGDTGGWCWIVRGTPLDVFWRYAQFYIIVWCAWGYSLFVYLGVKHKLLALADDADKKQQRVIRRTMYYPLVLVAVWAIPSVNRAYETFSGGNSSYGLSIMHAISSGLFGFANAVVYGLTDAVRSRLKGDPVSLSEGENEESNENEEEGLRSGEENWEGDEDKYADAEDITTEV